MAILLSTIFSRIFAWPTRIAPQNIEQGHCAQNYYISDLTAIPQMQGLLEERSGIFTWPRQKIMSEPRKLGAIQLFMPRQGCVNKQTDTHTHLQTLQRSTNATHTA